MILLRRPLVALCVVALTGLNEPHLVLLSSVAAGQCSIYAALFERDFSSQPEATVGVNLVQSDIRT